MGKIYILDQQNKPKLHEVKLGISDGNFTAVESEQLQEGQEVIVGYATFKASSTRSVLSTLGGGPPP
jgi:hypothetical protein